ncbi:MAG: hypothetical protein ACO4AV_14070 [bacterium]
MSRSILSLLLLLLLVPAGWSQEVTGEGVGSTKEQAKQEALADLSQNISVEVKSVQTQLSELIGGNFREDASSMIQLESRLPILGAESFVVEDVDYYSALARLSAQEVKPLYRNQLQQMEREIQQATQQLEKAESNAERETLLQEILEKLGDFKRHQTVLLVLGDNDVPKLQITETEIKSQLRQVQNEPDSLEQAARILTRDMQDRRGIYVYPFRTGSSQEITPFAAALRGRLQQQLSTVRQPDQATLWLYGTYLITDQGLELSAHLTQANNHQIEQSRSLFLPKMAYQGLEAKPSQISFEEQLRNNPDLLRKRDFRVSVRSNKGSQDLMFQEGDSLEIYVKPNKPGYFYIVGHTFAGEEPFSYLLDLQEEADPPRRFVQFVNADDVNRWISLGEFEIYPPLGLEHLQVIASKEDLVQRLPEYHFDAGSEFYLVGKDPTDGLAKTRAAKRPKKKSPENYSAEALLTYTSVPQ